MAARKRKYVTTRGIKRQLKAYNQKPRRRHKPRRHTTAKERLEAKKYRVRRKRRETSKDIKLDKLRSKFLRKRRNKNKHGLNLVKTGLEVAAFGGGFYAGRAIGNKIKSAIEKRRLRKAAKSQHALNTALVVGGGLVAARAGYEGGKIVERRKQKAQERDNALKAAAARKANKAKKASLAAGSNAHPLSLAKKGLAVTGVLGATYLTGRHHGHKDNMRV